MAADRIQHGHLHRHRVPGLRVRRFGGHEVRRAGDGPLPAQVRVQRFADHAVRVHDHRGRHARLQVRIHVPSLQQRRRREPAGREPPVAVLHLEGVGLLGHHLHRPRQEVASAVVPSRVPPHHHLPVLLAQRARELRRGHLPDHPPQRLHPHGDVHVLLHLHAHEGAGDRQVPSHLVEVLPHPHADDSVRHHDEPGLLPPRYQVRKDQPQGRLLVPRLHPVPLLPLRAVLRPIVHEAEEEEGRVRKTDKTDGRGGGEKKQNYGRNITFLSFLYWV
mmetsp:Transcript_32408/g.66250  ORF Transcript_32408/g.66250 Transcript_32408/m.66250 type:complete len:275 (-) Transcript_32408:73-897(-)